MAFNSEAIATEAADSTTGIHEKLLDMAHHVSNMSTDELISWGLSSVLSIASKIILALVIYIVGRWIIRKITKITKNIFEKRSVDVSLGKFIVSLTNITLSFILLLTTIGILGINTSAFIAVFASAGLAIGMALSGTLQNFAGGVLILFLKPFKVGDLIEAQGFTGTVKEISLFSTLLNTIDNKMVIIPNGELSNEAIYNYSKEPTRRVVWNIGIAYGSNFDRVKELILDEISKNDQIIQDQEVFVELNDLGDSALDIVVRVWCDAANYWSVYFAMNKAIYKRFNEEGVEFPFPQMDVHLYKKN